MNIDEFLADDYIITVDSKLGDLGLSLGSLLLDQVEQEHVSAAQLIHTVECILQQLLSRVEPQTGILSYHTEEVLWLRCQISLDLLVLNLHANQGRDEEAV